MLMSVYTTIVFVTSIIIILITCLLCTRNSADFYMHSTS